MKSDAPKTSPKDSSQPLAPLLVDARNAAKLAGISSATWHRMVAAGRTPAPVRPSRGCVRWRVTDLEQWIAAGCPKRSEFEAELKS